MSETRYITYNSINNLIPEDLFKEFLFKSGANSDRNHFYRHCRSFDIVDFRSYVYTTNTILSCDPFTETRNVYLDFTSNLRWLMTNSL